jgi:quinol monooxygenase YgiN
LRNWKTNNVNPLPEKSGCPKTFTLFKTTIMEKFALLARVEAKPGKEADVLAFLKSALPLAEAEPDTVRWYALQLGPSTFGIFDTFETTEGREAHLSGKIAEALMANASELLATAPVIEKVELLAIK